MTRVGSLWIFIRKWRGGLRWIGRGTALGAGREMLRVVVAQGDIIRGDYGAGEGIFKS